MHIATGKKKNNILSAVLTSDKLSIPFMSQEKV